MGMLRAAVIGAGFVGRAHIESLRRQGIPVIGVLGSSRRSRCGVGPRSAY